ncbi:hypothetical protein DKX38_007179 [Salix brachista]|uniref:Uncharacterized protein n=1 Tax=Salix brachista TaxID=2182728 RepID=A0A5N5MM68_9ROSI|nr:hypothetical protein DKX38_007179 [Salix brachista]
MIVQERDPNDDPMTVHHDVICDSVRELMRGDQGKKARERAQELGRKAKKAMEKGGSSGKKLDELIECLTLRLEFKDRPADPKAFLLLWRTTSMVWTSGLCRQTKITIFASSEAHVHIALKGGERLAGAVLLEEFSCAINSGFDGVPKRETSNR